MNWNEVQMTQAGLSPVNEETQRAFNASIREAADAIDKASRAVAQLSSNVDMEWSALETGSVKLKKQVRDCWQNALKLVKSAPAIFTAFESDLIHRIEETETALKKAEESTRKKLRAAGHSPESSPLYSANPQSAEVRFEHMVRTAEQVRLATDELEQARHNHKVWTMRIDSVGAWASIVSSEVQRYTARALNLV
jgi:septum formation inhibitor MinC